MKFERPATFMMSGACPPPAPSVWKAWIVRPAIADKMKRERGPLPQDNEKSDNYRVKRYISKFTINPAIANGISEYVGSIEIGKLADLVIWKPSFFGIRPETVIKSGMIAYAISGDPNASIPTPQVQMYKPQFGTMGSASSSLGVSFVSGISIAQNNLPRYMRRKYLPVKNTRTITKNDMVLNNLIADIEVDPLTYQVRLNGELLTSSPADKLPLTQRYSLF